MNDISIFQDETTTPTDTDLSEKLGPTYHLWKRIEEDVLKNYPNGLAEWNFPGKKYGWSFKIKDKKRAIIYLLPREGFFKAAFVFGDKATQEIMGSLISDNIKQELNQAKKYAEGRGIRVEIRDDSTLRDIEKMIDIKLNN